MADGCLLPAVRSRYRVISLMRRGARRPRAGCARDVACICAWCADPAESSCVPPAPAQAPRPCRGKRVHRPGARRGGGKGAARQERNQRALLATCWRPARDLLALAGAGHHATHIRGPPSSECSVARVVQHLHRCDGVSVAVAALHRRCAGHRPQVGCHGCVRLAG
jgi:hypothetical protein